MPYSAHHARAERAGRDWVGLSTTYSGSKHRGVHIGFDGQVCPLCATPWAPTATTSGPSTPFTRAPSVLGVTGWVPAPRRASRCVRARTGCICVRVTLRRVVPCTAPEPLGAHRSPGTCPLCMPGGGGRSARRVATAHAHEDPTSRMESPREALTASLHAPRGAPRGDRAHAQPTHARLRARRARRMGAAAPHGL